MDFNEQIDDALGIMASSLAQTPSKNQFMTSYLRGQQPPQTFAEGAGMPPQPASAAPMQQQNRPPQASMPQRGGASGTWDQPPQAMQPLPPPPQGRGGPPPQPMQPPQHPPGLQAPQMQPPQMQPPSNPLLQQYAGLDKQEGDLTAQIAKLNEPPDRSKAEAAYREHVAQGDQALMLALAAQQAGPGFAPMQQMYLKQHAEAQSPLKVAGGTYTPSGFIEDVDATANRKLQALNTQLQRIETLKNSNITEQSRQELKRSEDKIRQDMQQLQLGVTTAIAQAASADRRYQADLAHTDRQAALDAKGAGKGTVNPQHLIDLVGEARKYLPKATASGAGALVDQGAAFFGHSTQGAQATAQLNAIGGQLVMAQPRMEGPQSDKDVLLYRQMAGDVANDKLPIATRAAALDAIEALSQRYISGEYVPPTKQTGSTSGTWGQQAGPLVKARAAAEAAARNKPQASAPGEVSFGSLK